jgi:hypothetical protein
VRRVGRFKVGDRGGGDWGCGGWAARMDWSRRVSFSLMQQAVAMVGVDAVSTSQWQGLADRVLAGEVLDRSDAVAILNCPDVDIPQPAGRGVPGATDALWSLCSTVLPAKRQERPVSRGLRLLLAVGHFRCGDSQVPLGQREKLLREARKAKANQARTYCIVASGRGPSDKEVQHVAKACGGSRTNSGCTFAPVSTADAGTGSGAGRRGG